MLFTESSTRRIVSDHALRGQARASVRFLPHRTPDWEPANHAMLYKALIAADDALNAIARLGSVPELERFEADRMCVLDRYYFADVSEDHIYFAEHHIAIVDLSQKMDLVFAAFKEGSIGSKLLLPLVAALKDIHSAITIGDKPALQSPSGAFFDLVPPLDRFHHCSRFDFVANTENLCEKDLRPESRLKLLAGYGGNLHVAADIIENFVEHAQRQWTIGQSPQTGYASSEIHSLLAALSEFTTTITFSGEDAELFDGAKAFDVAQLGILACDLLLFSHSQSLLSGSQSSQRIGLSSRAVLSLGGRELPAPEIIVSQLAHLPMDLVTEREKAFLCAHGQIDRKTKVLIDLCSAFAVYMELGCSTLPGVTQNIVPVHSLLAGLRTGLEVVVNNQAEPRQSTRPLLTLFDVVSSVQNAQATLDRNFSALAVSGSLGPPGWRNVSHQTPVGISPFGLTDALVASGNNAAHAAETQLREFEDILVRLTRDHFGIGWEGGAGVTTSGGTASNKICIELARDLLGAGLAFQIIAEKCTLGIPQLSSISAQEALLLSPGSLSEIITTCDPEQLRILHTNFRTTLAEVQSRSHPIVVLLGTDWTHYTLGECLRSLTSVDLVQVPLNEHLKLDFEVLKAEIQSQFISHGIRPVLIPFSFCNTGFGVVGFDAKELRAFNTWLKEKYGLEAIYTFDAAQGGITFGIPDRELTSAVADARDVIQELAFGVTMDPHKYAQPVACSLLALRYLTLACFVNSHSSEPSYINCGDIAVIRSRVQLSASAHALLSNVNWLTAVKDGTHTEMFAPVLHSANCLYDMLTTESHMILWEGVSYRFYPLHEPHSGILGIVLLPVDASADFAQAQIATRQLHDSINTRNSPISCSRYVLQQQCLGEHWGDFVKNLSKQSGAPIDVRDANEIFALRFVFRGAGQEVLIEDLKGFSTPIRSSHVLLQ